MVAMASVAVIGAGPAGLAAIKSLKEEGFQVTGFERRATPGGLWAFSDDPAVVSVTSGTRYQLSKFISPFTDFPMPDDFPVHPTATQMAAYFQSYARHFDLVENIVFGVSVTSVRRNNDDTKWLLAVEGEETLRAFDRVVLATGSETVARMPEIEGLEAFRGRFLHGQAFKRPEDLKNQRVVVIGQGNSAGDCAVELSNHASKVYLAHRRGAMIFPRMVNGRRFDAFASWKLTRVGFFLGVYLPWLHEVAFYLYFSWIVWTAWGRQDPSWRFQPAPPSCAINIAGLMVNDELVPALRAGTVTSTHGVRRIRGPHAVELDDGTVLEDIDAVVACTGYRSSFGPLGDVMTFSRSDQVPSSQPNLYQNIFPLEHAATLACLSYVVIMDNAPTCREMAAMAVAQIWAGKSALPSREAMQAQVTRHQGWFAGRCRRHGRHVGQFEGLVEPHSWLRFVNDAAGTGVYERFGWGRDGWTFFLREPRLYSLAAWGVNSPHIYRLFDTGKRRAWDGAREAIIHVNRMSDADLRGKKDANVAKMV